jgi:hypothetical protein
MCLAVLAGALSPWASEVANAQLFPAYTSGVQVQNLEAEPATDVTLVAYNADGTTGATIGPDTIAAGGSKTYFPLAVPDGFQGSMVVSSSKRVAAIANVLSSTLSAGASYLAASQGATTVQLPLLMKQNSGFSTWYAVQNTGAAAATVNIQYSDGTTSGPHTIQPNAAQVIYQDDETHNAAVFSAIVTSNEPLVAAVIEENNAIMFAYTGFTSGATNPVFPLINANNAGYQTGAQVQNAGTQPTNVTVSYTPSTDGTACTETQTINPGASTTFALTAFAPGESAGESSNCADGVKFVGSAQVTANSANQPLVAIINQLGATNGGAYGSFDSAAATNKVVMPLIMDRNSGFFTGFNIMNVGTAATNVNCTFSGVGYTKAGTLQPNQALTDLQNGVIQPSYVGSGTCTADAGAKIVGVVNELRSSNLDQFLVYEGSNSN